MSFVYLLRVVLTDIAFAQQNDLVSCSSIVIADSLSCLSLPVILVDIPFAQPKNKKKIKKKMTINPFIGWFCPVANTKAKNKGCHAAMCNPCMAIWQSTGSRSNNQLSAQEVANVARMEQAKAKVKARTQGEEAGARNSLQSEN